MSKQTKSSRPRIVLVNRALVFNENGEILLIQRSKTDTHNAGKWELPGGKLDVGQDLSNALEREVLEETGLVIIPTDKLVYWTSSIIADGKYKGLPYIVLIGMAKSIGGKVTLSEEHDNYVWAKKDEVFEKEMSHETKAALKVLINKI